MLHRISERLVTLFLLIFAVQATAASDAAVRQFGFPAFSIPTVTIPAISVPYFPIPSFPIIPISSSPGSPQGNPTPSVSASPSLLPDFSHTPLPTESPSPSASAGQYIPPTPSESAAASVQVKPTPSAYPAALSQSPSNSADPSADPPASPSASPSATPSVSVSLAPVQFEAVRINLGGDVSVGQFAADEGQFITGKSGKATLSGEGIYKSHRFGKNFGLDFKMKSGVYDVILHFSENFNKACAIDIRVFTVTVGDKPPLVDLDVFKEAGCNTPLRKIIKEVEVTDSLVVTIVAKKQSAFLSGIEILPTDPELQIPSPTPKPLAKPHTELKINVAGPTVEDFEADQGLYLTGFSIPHTLNGPLSGVYESHRAGKKFGYSIPMAPGDYDVVLHFAENFGPNCETGKRIFSAKIGDKTLPNLGIFDKVGCNTPTTETVKGITVTDSLAIDLEASVMNAFLAAVEIAPASDTPTPTPDLLNAPVPSPASPVDTGAHAVPGVYTQAFIDFNKDGKEVVTLDGSGSHTHTVNVITGAPEKVVNFRWTIEGTNQLICPETDQPFCKGTFNMGTTMVELCVTDSTNDVHCDSTTITVAGSIANGAYCYNYDFGSTSDSKLPIKKGLEAKAGASPKPVSGFASNSLSFPNLAGFPDFPFKSGSWAQRCKFFFSATKEDTYKFTVKHIGGAALYVGEEELFSKDATNSATTTTSEGSIHLPEGLQQIELLYYKTGSEAQLELTYNATGAEIQHDKAMVLPLISSVDPGSSNLKGATVKIIGTSIDKETEVLFGSAKATNLIFSEPTQVQAKAPPVSAPTSVDVVLQNRAGTSNALKYVYSGGVITIAFSGTKFKKKGKDFEPNVVANIAIGPDFKYYMTTLSGKVIVAEVDHDDGYEVKDSCESPTLFDPRWINHKTGKSAERSALGIAFNPKDTTVKAYVATSTLFWGEIEKDILRDDFAWANGNIEIVEPVGKCVDRTGSLITGLPVSNHDHAVNGMVFDNNGDLHFQVGGFTNQGIPGEGLGNVDENPLSAASLIAKTSSPTFNGEITYDNKDPALAKQVSGDVSVYASGLRNSFGLLYHTNGNFYATDNGPNKGFGDKSISCSEKGASSRNGDKFLLLGKGKYHGHPNRNRGECVFIDDNNKAPNGGKPPAYLNYQPFLAKIESSTDGLIEYTANTFGGALRGNIFAGKYAGQFGGKLFRIQLKGNGGLASGPDQFGNFGSGLSMVLGHRGEIIMPRVFQKEVLVLAPQYEPPPGPQIIAVTPFRGGKGGGKVVLITGHKFGTSPTAKFGSAPCTNVADVTPTSFKCTTPAGSGLVDVSVTSDGITATAPEAFWYMNV